MSDSTYKNANQFYSDMTALRQSRPPEERALRDALYDAEEKARRCTMMFYPRRKDHDVWVEKHKEALLGVDEARSALSEYLASKAEAA